jgi:hypothetical protein
MAPAGAHDHHHGPPHGYHGPSPMPVPPVPPQELTVAYIGNEGEWVELRHDALAPLAGLRGLVTLRLIAQKLTHANVGMTANLAILGHTAVGTDGSDRRL